MTTTVEVLDRCMGSGKTTACFKWMSQHINERWLYITPLLSEAVHRISVDAPDMEFRNPSSENGSKGDDMLLLLKEGANISSTHALFSTLTREHLALIYQQQYIIVIDEEFGMIEPMEGGYNSSDREFLIRHKLISIDEADQGRVRWLEGDETKTDSKYGKFKSMCDVGMVFAAKRKDVDGINKFMVNQLPVDLITAAKRIVVLTYLFNGSVMDSFLKLKGVDVIPFTEYDVIDKHPSEYKDLINFVGQQQRKKLSTLSLSSTGYTKLTQAELDLVAKAIKAIGIYTKSNNRSLVYSVPKEYAKPTKSNAKRIKPNGFAAGDGSTYEEEDLATNTINTYASGCWLFSESRATNLYRNRKTMIYCIDKYPQTPVKAYLQDYGYDVNNDVYALSSLLQWLFRGCIRTGLPMNVCCISTKDRMHKLLEAWLAGEYT